jgi:hypothetical protein
MEVLLITKAAGRNIYWRYAHTKVGVLIHPNRQMQRASIKENMAKPASMKTERVWLFYRDDDTSLARPTSQCILFDAENISFDTSLVIYV